MDINKRLRMHSETLQETFPDVYREFFSKCTTVISAPGTYYWSAGLGVMYGGVGVMQKLPIRVYVGIERDNHKSLRYGEYICFAPHQQQFEFSHHDKSWEVKFIKLLNDLRKGLPEIVNGKIHILSEVPNGAGLNQSGAINIALSVLLALESGLIDTSKLNELTNAKTPDIVQDPVFNQIFRFAWKLEASAEEGASSGAAPFASFLESATPVAFYSERREGTYGSHPNSRFPSLVDGHFEVFDQIQFTGYRLKEMFSWLGDASWPIDYGLMYLGRQKNLSAYLKPMRVVQESLTSLEHFVGKYIKNFPGSFSPDLMPSFISMTQSYDRQGFWKNSVDFLIILSVKSLFDLKSLIENGTDDSLDNLYHSVNLQERIYEFFTSGLPLSDERDLLSRLKHVLHDKSSNGFRNVRFLPDRGDGGGDMLFIAPQGYLQDNIENFQMLLRTHISPLVRIDYASWLDGDETGGARIEQHFATNTYSSFVTQGSISMLEWRQGELMPTRRVYSVEGFAKSRPQIDLLLNEVDQKVYVRGFCLTSKDIKSSKATIEICKSLLDNYGREIAATTFPDSAYIERNEMQSKIITPLVASVKRYTGKKLPLSLHGGLRKNFNIKLQPSSLTIGVLERQI